MAKRTISGKQVLEDIRAGMTDMQLIRKYDLHPPGLQKLFNKLIETGLITQEELDERGDDKKLEPFRETAEQASKAGPSLANAFVRMWRVWILNLIVGIGLTVTVLIISFSKYPTNPAEVLNHPTYQILLLVGLLDLVSGIVGLAIGAMGKR